MKNKLTGKELLLEVAIGVICICLLCLQCGCDDIVKQRDAVMNDSHSSEVFSLSDLNQQSIHQCYIVRKADNSIWIYRTEGTTDSVASKSQIFLSNK